MTRRAGVLAAAIAGCALLGTPGAAWAADVVATGTKVSIAKVDASTRSIIYYVDLRNTTASDQFFSVRLTPPSFATKGGRDEGQSIDGPRQLALQGPGTLGQLVQDPRFDEPCSDRDSAFHGYATGPASVDMLLPASNATTLAVRYAAGRRAPWADSDFRLKFSIQPKLVGTYQEGQVFFGRTATVGGTSTTASRGPTADGALGAHLLLNTWPTGVWGEGSTPRSVKYRSRVTLSGRLLPAEAKRRVDLQLRKPGGALRTIASVRTDKNGRFRGSWRATTRGIVEFWARYPRQSGKLRADSTSCPMRLRVR